LTFNFAIRTALLHYENYKFILIYFQNITESERQMMLERVFLHDMNNLISGINFSFDILSRTNAENWNMEIQRFKKIIVRLKEEIIMQSVLSEKKLPEIYFRLDQVSLDQLAGELYKFFDNHESAFQKKLNLPDPVPQLSITTNESLLFRVLVNLLINAFEATQAGGEVKLLIEYTDPTVTFKVWNAAFIPENITLRIFQQYYSTKAENGRGFGTFGIKLFTEKYLGGKVFFETSEINGTTFHVTIPKTLKEKFFSSK
jgi:signal transduction histidine kinase